MSLPPYAKLLGLSLEAAEIGAPIVAMSFCDALVGRPGFVHGGALGGVMEIAAIVALRDALADDAVVIKPVNLSVDYMRGARDKPTRAQGIVRRLGTRIANVDTIAWQDDPASPIAISRHSFLLRR